MNAVDRHLPMGRMLRVAHDLVAFVILAFAVVKFAALPQFPRVTLLYFVPPVLAFLFLAFNTGKFNPTVLCGCRLFLSMIAIAVLLGELPFVLPNLKPLFPGMPANQDRVIAFYFAAYGLFLWVICPGYVLSTSLYRDVYGLPGRMSRPILYGGCACWLVAMGFLVAAVTITDKLF
jgi:hypothetical protein